MKSWNNSLVDSSKMVADKSPNISSILLAGADKSDNNKPNKLALLRPARSVSDSLEAAKPCERFLQQDRAIFFSKT